MSGGGAITPTVTYTWPEDLPEPKLPISDEFDMPLVINDTEMGVKKTRPEWTDEDEILHLFFPLLTSAHRATILAFFREIGWGGTIFEFPHPEEEEVLYVRLASKVIFQHLGASKFALPLKFEKANTG